MYYFHEMNLFINGQHDLTGEATISFARLCACKNFTVATLHILLP